MEFICPNCGEKLKKEQKTYRCANNHSFDIARQGYVNLLTVQQKHSLNPGDTNEQVQARREFLSEGFYAPIVEALIRISKKYQCQGPLLDVGCGEGYYCTQLAQALNAELIGVDISKEAVRFAAAKYKGPSWLCATASHLPMKSRSVGLITSLFALTMAEEYHRILKDDGYYIQILAAEDHLLGLKSIIYPKLIMKPKNSVPEIEGFLLVESESIRFTFSVQDKQVQNLLSMTPHAHRITKDGVKRLSEIKILQDTASCVINIYQKV